MLRVAVVAQSERQRRYLAEVLEPHGVQVVADDELRACLPDRVDQDIADVLLVDLQEEEDGDLDLDALIDQTGLPMLFNDGDASKRHAPKSIAGKAWGRRLADKLTALVKDEAQVPPVQVGGPALKLVVEQPRDPHAPPTETIGRTPDLGAALGFELDTELEFETGLQTQDAAFEFDTTPVATVEDPTVDHEAIDFSSLDLPDLGDADEQAEHRMQSFEAPPSMESWTLEPAGDTEQSTPSNEMDFDTVPTLSDDAGLIGFELEEPSAARDAGAKEAEALPTLSEDLEWSDDLNLFAADVVETAELDDLPALVDEVELSAALNLDDPVEAVAAELCAEELDGELATSLKLEDLEALAETIEPATTPWLGDAVPDAPAPQAAAADQPVADGQMPVWVLGASIGGPQAVKEFIAKLPADTPAAFVIAQHIGSGFVDLLASQLDRVTPLEVLAAQSGMVLRPGRIVVAPVEQRLTFSDGVIALQPNRRKSVYSPSIDDVMTEVADAFGDRANAIVFSGMGSDGVEGARAIAAAGGMVWGQESSTCVISSMADSARDAGVVSESGAPVQLAQRLLETLNRETAHA